MDEFFDILHEEPLNRWYQIGNVIAIVDSKLERDGIVRRIRFLAMDCFMLLILPGLI